MSTVNRDVDVTTRARAHGGDVRAAGAAGIAAVVTMVATFAVIPSDSGGFSPQDIARRYADGSSGYLRATVLESLSVGLFCVFVAGLSVALWRRQQGGTAPLAAAVGGTLLATCQLLGYAVIATLAYGSARDGDQALVMALYDLSSVFFVVANIGLAVLCAATGYVLVRGSVRRLVLGWSSITLAAVAAVAAGSYAPSGIMSVHGDLGFLVVLLQLGWTVAVCVRLLLPGQRRVVARQR